MSRNDIRKAPRLAPRAVRIRNRCLANLAERHSLPLPSEQDVGALDDSVGLGDSWKRWEASHTPAHGAAGVVATQKPPRTQRAGLRPVLAGLVLFVAFSSGFVGFKFFDHWREQQAAASALAASGGWVPITDSTIATLRGKLLGIGATEVSLRVTLTTADVGALIIAGLEPRPGLPLDSLKVRIDTLVWIQSRVRGASHIEIGGRLRATRPGRAELQVVRLLIDGVETLPSTMSRATLGLFVSPGNRLQFIVPTFVGELHLDNRVVQLVTRAQLRASGQRRRTPS
jgi:hypothetical protein